MEGFNDYYIYISSGFILLTFFIALKNFGHIRRISKHFSTKKFRINAFYEIDSSTSDKFFVVSFYNTSISDSIITSLGFVYKDQNIDLYTQYCREHNINPNSKVIVPTKGSISIKIDYDNLKEIITSLNEIKYNVSKIETFTVDSIGFVSKRKAKIVRKILLSKLKLENKNLLINNKNKKKKDKQELKKSIRENKVINRAQKSLQRKQGKDKSKEKRTLKKIERRNRVKKSIASFNKFFSNIYMGILEFFKKIRKKMKKKKETQ